MDLRKEEQRLAFLDWLLRQERKTALWAAKGPELFDCSGLVTVGYELVGVKGFPPALTNTDRLWNALPSMDKPRPGDLVFYGGEHPRDVSHVMVWWGDGRVYGACGATSRIETEKEAVAVGARVRFRKPGYRPDFRGYRRSPFDEETVHA